MTRIYHHYRLWEDWIDGLYRQTITPAEDVIVSRASRLLASPDWLHKAMMQVAIEWRHAGEVNLSNRHRNRQAWLGQAACCLVCGATEDLTKKAWHILSLAEQEAANRVADKVIAYWEIELCPKQA
jgi:hypothetical protein